MQLIEINPFHSKRVVITFGGGMGGSRYQYVFCNNVKSNATKIQFDGFQLNDLERPNNDYNKIFVLDMKSNKMYIFDVSYWPRHRIYNLQNCISQNNYSEALKEYQATDKKNYPQVIEKERVVAVSNWFLREFKDGK